MVHVATPAPEWRCLRPILQTLATKGRRYLFMGAASFDMTSPALHVFMCMCVASFTQHPITYSSPSPAAAPPLNPINPPVHTHSQRLHKSGYKTVKGRSHSVEGRTSTPTQPPRNQPAISAVTHGQPHCTANTATDNTPYPRRITTSTLAPQHQHQNANPAHARLPARSGGTSQHSPSAASPVAAALPSAQVNPWECAHSPLRLDKSSYMVMRQARFAKTCFLRGAGSPADLVTGWVHELHVPLA